MVATGRRRRTRGGVLAARRAADDIDERLPVVQVRVNLDFRVFRRHWEGLVRSRRSRVAFRRFVCSVEIHVTRPRAPRDRARVRTRAVDFIHRTRSLARLPSLDARRSRVGTAHQSPGELSKASTADGYFATHARARRHGRESLARNRQ